MIGERAAMLHHVDPCGREIAGEGVVANAELEPDDPRPRTHGEDVVEVARQEIGPAEDVDDVHGREDRGAGRAHQLHPEGGAGERGVDREDAVSLRAEVVGRGAAARIASWCAPRTAMVRAERSASATAVVVTISDIRRAYRVANAVGGDDAERVPPPEKPAPPAMSQRPLFSAKAQPAAPGSAVTVEGEVARVTYEKTTTRASRVLRVTVEGKSQTGALGGRVPRGAAGHPGARRPRPAPSAIRSTASSSRWRRC